VQDAPARSIEQCPFIVIVLHNEITSIHVIVGTLRRDQTP